MSINSKLTGRPHVWSDGLLSFYLSCSTHWVGSWVDHIHVLDHCKKYNVGYVAMHIIVMANPSEPKYGYCCILCLFRIKHKDVKEIIYSLSYYIILYDLVICLVVKLLKYWVYSELLLAYNLWCDKLYVYIKYNEQWNTDTKISTNHWFKSNKISPYRSSVNRG